MGVAWHRFLAPFNVFFKRESDGSTALGAMKPLTSEGKAITLDDIDDLDEDSVLGVGKVEDFSWKGILDFTSCTECGRCQSQCPAWNTEKPLSPKLLITALRDHAYAKAPYLQAGSEEERTALPGDVLTEAERPLIGDESVYGVIDPDVLWSCTSCGACVQQCPVDIEHVDHIMDMRRYQLLVESNFPAELNQLFKGLENKGNPWNMSPSARMDWAKDLPFEVKVVGEDVESLDEVDWLFWVGCAGAYEDRAKKTTRAVAELLDLAGVSFGVLGNGETCTGDPARRAGNEFVFQGLAQQNAETFTEYKVKKVVSTCAHCFNTLKNEYKDFGVELEVVHHTQLLNRLVREGKLTPVAEGAGAAKRSITYHDPCYIGRHNGVYSPPRELLQVLPGAEVVEMERNSERSFCCGAGGARMWMEENIGERINLNRTKEAVGTGADQIAVGCPFCRVMLSDGLTSEQASGNAREEVEVLDVAQMLLASVKGEVATRVKKASAPAAAAATGATVSPDEATKAEPEAGDVTQTADTVTDTEDVGPAAKASGGTSLFDTPADEAEQSAPASTSLFDTPAEEPKPSAEPAAASGSLFDTPADAPASEEATPEPEAAAPADQPAAKPADDGLSSGSLFDIAAPEEPAAKASAPAAEPEAVTENAGEEPAEDTATSVRTTSANEDTTPDLGAGGSLFDIKARHEEKAAPAEAASADRAGGAPSPSRAGRAASPQSSRPPRSPTSTAAAACSTSPPPSRLPRRPRPPQQRSRSLLPSTERRAGCRARARGGSARARSDTRGDGVRSRARHGDPRPRQRRQPVRHRRTRAGCPGGHARRSRGAGAWGSPEPEPAARPSRNRQPEAAAEPEPEKPATKPAPASEPKQADITAADSLFDL